LEHRVKHRSIVSAVLVAVFAASWCGAQSVDQGVALYNSRKYAEAKAALLPFGEKDPVAAFHLGQISMGENEDGKAAEWFERATRMNPKSSIYYDWLGRSYGRQAQRANKLRQPFLARRTKSAWETALALDPDNLDVRENLIAYYAQAPGFLGGSKEKAREMVGEITKRNTYRGSIAMANLCSGEKDEACVEREVSALLKAYPDSTSLYVSAAVLYASQKKFDKAFDLLDQRQRAKPNEPVILYQIGRTASVSGENLDRGEQALKAYIASPAENGPAPANAHYRLGLIYEKKGSKDLARREYQNALRLRPKMADAEKALRALDR
jgi:tetratricopeptide (TPR) repeat protein